MKRFLYILIGILALALIALLVYWFFFNTPAFLGGEGVAGKLPAPATDIPQTPGGGAAGQGAASSRGSTTGSATSSNTFGVVSKLPVLDYFVGDKNVILIISPDGKLFEQKKDASSGLQSQAIPNLQNVSFSYDGSFVLYRSGVQNYIKNKVYDIKNSKWVPLPDTIGMPAWSPVANSIVYISSDGILAVQKIDASSSTPEKLLPFEVLDPVLYWTNPHMVIIADRGTGYSLGTIWKVSLESKNVFVVSGSRYGTLSKWASLSRSGLLSYTEEKGRGNILSIVDDNGAKKNILRYNTIPDKCAFVGNEATTTRQNASGTQEVFVPASLLCAVPQNYEEWSSAVLPDDYLMGKLDSVDGFFLIQMQSGDSSLIPLPQGIFMNAQTLRVMENKLFFVNNYDHFLYGLSFR